jgi:hypothetical protein
MKPFANALRATDAALKSRDGAATKLAMTRLAKASRFVQLAAVLAVAGCSSSSSSNGSGGDDTTCKTGKEAAFANPAGTPLALPAGITIDGDATGDIDTACPDKNLIENGGDVLLVCMTLKNTTAAEVSLTIPAGLTFVAKDPATMNGIILHDHTGKVPANGSVSLYFRPFSLNRACTAGGKEDRFTVGNIASDPRLREVISLAATKRINGDEGAYALGQMIWDITDESGITDEHRTLLKNAADL